MPRLGLPSGEMKGVPLRLEIGPQGSGKNQCVLVRRDTREKIFVSLDELETAIPAQLEALRKDLYQRALENREKAHLGCHHHGRGEGAGQG